MTTGLLVFLILVLMWVGNSLAKIAEILKVLVAHELSRGRLGGEGRPR